MLNRRHMPKNPTAETTWFDTWLAAVPLGGGADAEGLAFEASTAAAAAGVNLGRVLQHYGYKTVRDLLLDRLDERADG